MHGVLSGTGRRFVKILGAALVLSALTNSAAISATITASGSPVMPGTVSSFAGGSALAANVPVNRGSRLSFTFNTTGVTASVLTDSTTITPVSDLRISKTTSSTFVQGGTASYSLIVSNTGAGASSGAYTISDTMPTGLTIALVTGSTWDCSASTTTFVNCVRSTSIPANIGSAPSVTINVNIAANAPASITNTATVAGGGEVNTANNSGNVTSSVTQLAPDLAVTKVAQGGPFQQGGTVTYSIIVSNQGNGPTSGTVTMQDTIPTALTVTSVAGTNWNCTIAQPVVCTRTTPIAAGANSVITLQANIAANAPTSVTNTASVSGGGESNTGNNSGSAVISVSPVTPDLTVTKVAQGSGFVQSGTVTYSITVSNQGNGPTSGTVTMQDTIPTALTLISVAGAGWNCTNASTVVCTSATPIPASGNSVITLQANIAANAPTSITNTASVSGGGESITNNNSGSSVISVGAVAPDLTVTKVAQGAAFARGGTVTYLITVSNQGNGPTTGTVTMQDTIPTALTVASATGTNWNCTIAQPVVCIRTTPIAAGANSVITLQANIAANAPTSITNTASVTGGGESNTGNNSGSSVISVGTPAALTVGVTGGTWGSVVSTPSGIDCPGTCTANFLSGSVVTLTRQVNVASDGEFVGWTDPPTCASAANSSNPTCAVTMNAAQTAAARFTVSCRLDADGDGAVRSSTDTLMITRRALGITGTPVITSAFNPDGTRTTEATINAYISPRIAENRYDVNLDGVTDWRDAAILSRAFSGFTGAAVTEGLITAGSQRQFWDQPTPNGVSDGIKQYLNSRCGAAIP